MEIVESAFHAPTSSLNETERDRGESEGDHRESGRDRRESDRDHVESNRDRRESNRYHIESARRSVSFLKSN